MYTPSYLDLCRITRKCHLGLAKAGLNSGVVLILSGLKWNFTVYKINDMFER